MSVLAHNGVAKAYYNDEEYDKAMEHFEIAETEAVIQMLSGKLEIKASRRTLEQY